MKDVEPRKVYFKGRVKNYHICGYSITFGSQGELWIYDLVERRPVSPVEEDDVKRNILEGGG